MVKNTKVILGTLASAALITGGGVIGAATSGASAVTHGHDGHAVAAAKARAAGLGPQVTGTATSIAPNGNGTASVTCPGGSFLTGGGDHTSGYSIFVTDTYGSGNTWTVIGHNDGSSGNTETLTAYARCLKLL
jgi:hypothetical protein